MSDRGIESAFKVSTTTAIPLLLSDGRATYGYLPIPIVCNVCSLDPSQTLTMSSPTTSASSSDPRSNTDCYYYYYSSCAKGAACPFRHEPAALAQETVCTYWQKGKCTMPHCIYRHMEAPKKSRNTTKCYWETQPGGCRKPHCPFLHEAPKQPYTEEVAKILEQPANTIIVNKNKIQELSQMILPVRPGVAAAVSAAAATGPSSSGRRIVVSSSSERPRASVKSRLGPRRIDARLRLGKRPGDQEEEGEGTVEVFEYSDDEKRNSEEDDLRANAIKTLDLRNRLTSRKIRVVESDEDVLPEDRKPEYEFEEEADEGEGDLEAEDEKKVRSVVKKIKKEKKEKEKKRTKKKLKREKKERREKGKVQKRSPSSRTGMNLGARALLSLKADASSSSGKKSKDNPEISSPEMKKDLKRAKRDAEARAEFSPSPSPPPPSVRARKRVAAADLLPDVDDDEESSPSQGKKKSLAAEKKRTKSESEAIDDFEKFLKDDAGGSTGGLGQGTEADDSTDVIKEMDEFFNQ